MSVRLALLLFLSTLAIASAPTSADSNVESPKRLVTVWVTTNLIVATMTLWSIYSTVFDSSLNHLDAIGLMCATAGLIAVVVAAMTYVISLCNPLPQVWFSCASNFAQSFFVVQEIGKITFMQRSNPPTPALRFHFMSASNGIQVGNFCYHLVTCVCLMCAMVWHSLIPLMWIGLVTPLAIVSLNLNWPRPHTSLVKTSAILLMMVINLNLTDLIFSTVAKGHSVWPLWSSVVAGIMLIFGVQQVVATEMFSRPPYHVHFPQEPHMILLKFAMGQSIQLLNTFLMSLI